MRKNNRFKEFWKLLSKTDNSQRIGSLSTVHDILWKIWGVNFEDLMETRESEHSKDVLERIRVCEKSSLIILNLVFFFKCQMISSSSSNVCVVLPISLSLLCPRLFFVCFSLSMNFFSVSCIFDFYGILYCFTSIIWVIPNKTVKKINRRSVPPLSRALLGQLNIVWSYRITNYRIVIR